MPFGDSGQLAGLQAEIEAFMQSLSGGTVIEGDTELFDLGASHWQLTIEFGKLLLNLWDARRSVVRRVDAIAFREEPRLGLLVRRPGASQASILEIRKATTPIIESDAAKRDADAVVRSTERRRFRDHLVQVIGAEFPGWKLERVSTRSDREHSFSAWYTRGLARQGKVGWAFLGLSENEPQAAADSALAYGLIWLDWLRRRGDGIELPGLKLFLPPNAVEVNAHHAAYLNRRAVQLGIVSLGRTPESVDLCDFGNAATKLRPRRDFDRLIAHRDAARAYLSRETQLPHNFLQQLDLVPDAESDCLSVLVRGLEVARITFDEEIALTFELPETPRKQRLDHLTRPQFRDLLLRACAIRASQSAEPGHDLHRVQAERWLESLLLKDVTKVDPALMPAPVYSQVPAFAGGDRGVVDLLGVTCAAGEGRGQRLAVVELKVQEQINLPFQGLDYWLRVKWLAARREFRAYGYFPGVELSGRSPLLYLVSPAFRFHSTNRALLGYLDPQVEVVQVGINENWRNGVKVLFRRTLRDPAT
jgi:hypothetical protein